MSEFTDDLKHIARFDTPRDPRKACLEAADRIEALEAALRDFQEIAKQAKPNCGHKLRAVIQAAQETHSAALPHP